MDPPPSGVRVPPDKPSVRRAIPPIPQPLGAAVSKIPAVPRGSMRRTLPGCDELLHSSELCIKGPHIPHPPGGPAICKVPDGRPGTKLKLPVLPGPANFTCGSSQKASCSPPSLGPVAAKMPDFPPGWKLASWEEARVQTSQGPHIPHPPGPAIICKGPDGRPGMKLKLPLLPGPANFTRGTSQKVSHIPQSRGPAAPMSPNMSPGRKLPALPGRPDVFCRTGDKVLHIPQPPGPAAPKSPVTPPARKLPALPGHGDLVCRTGDKASVEECNIIVNASAMAFSLPAAASGSVEFTFSNGLALQNVNSSAKTSVLSAAPQGSDSSHTKSPKYLFWPKRTVGFKAVSKPYVNSRGRLKKNHSRHHHRPLRLIYLPYGTLSDYMKDRAATKKAGISTPEAHEKAEGRVINDELMKGQVTILSNRRQEQIPPHVLQKIFRRNNYRASDMSPVLIIIEDTLYEVVQRIVIDMGCLPYSLKYFIAGTVRCASHTTTSELNILSCVEILKQDSKVDVRFTASITADLILAKVYAVIASQLQAEEPAQPGGMFALSDGHGHTDVTSETQPCDISKDSGNAPKPPALPAPLSVAEEIVQEVVDKLEMFVMSRLELIAECEPRYTDRMTHECESAARNHKTMPPALPISECTSFGGDHHKASEAIKERMISKMKFSDPLLILPCCISTKCPKRLLSHIYVSKYVLQLHAKSVLRDILVVIESELKQDDQRTAFGTGVLPSYNTAVATRIVGSLIRCLFNEKGRSSHYQHQLNVPRRQSHGASYSSPVDKIKLTRDLPSGRLNPNDVTDCFSQRAPLRVSSLNTEQENDKMPPQVLNALGHSQCTTSIQSNSKVRDPENRSTADSDHLKKYHLAPGISRLKSIHEASSPSKQDKVAAAIADPFLYSPGLLQHDQVEHPVTNSPNNVGQALKALDNVERPVLVTAPTDGILRPVQVTHRGKMDLGAKPKIKCPPAKKYMPCSSVMLEKSKTVDLAIECPSSSNTSAKPHGVKVSTGDSAFITCSDAVVSTEDSFICSNINGSSDVPSNKPECISEKNMGKYIIKQVFNLDNCLVDEIQRDILAVSEPKKVLSHHSLCNSSNLKPDNMAESSSGNALIESSLCLPAIKLPGSNKDRTSTTSNSVISNQGSVPRNVCQEIQSEITHPSSEIQETKELPISTFIVQKKEKERNLPADSTRLEHSKKIDNFVETTRKRTSVPPAYSEVELKQASGDKHAVVPNDMHPTLHQDRAYPKYSGGGLIHENQTSLPDDELYRTKLGDILIGIANRIFPSSPSVSNIPESRSVMARNAKKLVIKLMQDIKSQFWNSIDKDYESWIYSQTNVQQVVDSVCSNILKDYESLGVLQREIKRKNTWIFHNMANLIIMHLIYKRHQTVLSPESSSRSEHMPESKDVIDEQTQSNLNKPQRNSFYSRVYSVTLLENIISGLLSRVFTSSDIPVCGKNGEQYEEELCQVILKCLNSISLYLTENQIKVIRSNEEMHYFPPINNDNIDKAVDSVYCSILQEYHSHLAVYTNLTKGNSVFVKITIDFVLAEMADSSLERGALEEVASSLDTAFIIQNVLTSIGTTSKQCHPSVMLSPTIWLATALPKIISNILPAFLDIAALPESQHSVAEEAVVKLSELLRCKIMARISNGTIWNVKNSNFNKYVQTQEDIQSVVEAVSIHILEIWNTPEAVHAVLSGRNETLHDMIAAVIISEMVHHLQPPLPGEALPCLSTSLSTSHIRGAEEKPESEQSEGGTQLKKPVLGEINLSQMKAVTIYKDTLEANDVKKAQTKGKKSSRQRSKIATLNPHIMNYPIKIDPSIISDQLKALEMKNEPADVLEKQGFLQTDQNQHQGRRAASYVNSTSDETSDSKPVYPEVPEGDEHGRCAPLGSVRCDVKPEKRAHRKSSLSEFKQDTTNVELLRDVKTKQKHPAEQETHEIDPRESKDIEGAAMNRPPCLADSKDSLLLAQQNPSQDEFGQTQPSPDTKKKSFIKRYFSCKSSHSSKTEDSQKVSVPTSTPEGHRGVLSLFNKKGSASKDDGIKTYGCFSRILHLNNSNERPHNVSTDIGERNSTDVPAQTPPDCAASSGSMPPASRRSALKRISAAFSKLKIKK